MSVYVIIIILRCDICGHEWNFEDYTNGDVKAAETRALEEKCPNCDDGENTDGKKT